MKSLRVTKTPIAGLLVVDLPLHGDNRGWFKEHWQREKMVALGLPDFGPVQQNISFNAEVGTTRGIHAEPWDKYVSVANGSAFGAWVDLREGASFGTSFSIELTPSRAVFVPRGVANAFQTLEPNTSYMYLVNDHWSETAQYVFLNLEDPTAAIKWPIPLNQAIVSAKDRGHPMLSQVAPVPPMDVVVLGANGQLGKALRNYFPEKSTRFLSRIEIDLSSPSSILSYDWSNVGTIVNAAAYTAVDKAEEPSELSKVWQVNAGAVGALARIATKFNATLVTVSSDYVFDGTQEIHSEEEPLSPLGAYGQSKAAGELAAAVSPKHYIIRTSWVVGDGPNFVRTMLALSKRGVEPKVINDQVGRLTFADDLARAILHLLQVSAPYGIYNVSNGGTHCSWFDVARKTFELAGAEPNSVHATSSAEYSKSLESAGTVVAPRPKNSVLDLRKIQSTGFTTTDWVTALADYIANGE
ncbi:bifunctional dTDP-4-dehydrorhamnose 3,5-epimerase family protein/NAD(P)-dependent oxidoreductase [Timonella senegalensis]|uniref:bifunctional dTDP-4-dehydrorhamnose 3,5-epimerase family protein/NAD(P)-dependent oxidoreductase n=1 Tax=Timonella senegalensis TaxID=1465825 RepID=UPI002FDD1588